jgi:hypothetical protein
VHSTEVGPRCAQYSSRAQMCTVLKFVVDLFLYNSNHALSSIKHKTLNQQMHSYYYFFLDIFYNPRKPAQHVSIPFWDHHQGHL